LLQENTYKAIQKAIESGVKVTDIVKYYIDNINKNKHLNIYLEVFEKEALQKAEEIQQKISDKKAGKLAGMVIALKDNICYQNHKVSASSKILENFESLFSATVVEKLLAEDAIIIGRVNCDEFAMGGSNENSAFGPVLNPHDNKRVSGGSSGGSAAAVAANTCTVALGSDTGGSIRQPAAFNGIVGLKPTYGRVSRHGLIAFASSFDQIGPLAKSVNDCALVLEIIAGNDDFDNTASSKKTENYSETKASEGKLKIAYFKDYIENEGLDKEVKSKFLEKVEQLKSDGHIVEALDFSIAEFLIPTYYILTTAEASSNLSRFDGVHYGYRSPNAFDLESTYKKSRSEGFGKEVKRRIMLGTFVLSAGYYDAFYGKAQKARRLIAEGTKSIFKDFDFIISPTTPNIAFEIGKKNQDPLSMYLEDIYTVQANLAGIPAISVPVWEKDNMPLGLQIMANDFEEAKLLAFAKYLLLED
jgi:aspartyl-tRNA(Asn)/glutamyl-tRNA(Gln) amidotransferase subunit A